MFSIKSTYSLGVSSSSQKGPLHGAAGASYEPLLTVLGQTSGFCALTVFQAFCALHKEAPTSGIVQRGVCDHVPVPHVFPYEATARGPVQLGAQPRLNANCFFLTLFGHFRDIRAMPNFWAPTPSRGRPPPHQKISGLKSLGLGSFFVPDQ